MTTVQHGKPVIPHTSSPPNYILTAEELVMELHISDTNNRNLHLQFPKSQLTPPNEFYRFLEKPSDIIVDIKSIGEEDIKREIERETHKLIELQKLENIQNDSIAVQRKRMAQTFDQNTRSEIEVQLLGMVRDLSETQEQIRKVENKIEELNNQLSSYGKY